MTEVERAAPPKGGPARLKQDRDEVFIEFTRSICPVCKVVVDAPVNIRGDKVYLRKRCREHGERPTGCGETRVANWQPPAPAPNVLGARAT